MTHEFKSIIQQAIAWHSQGLALVLATVVHLEGSSYRRPGVRMLLAQNGKWIGAVSGGCVEKEVYREAQKVFKTNKARLMSYDGTYRLGCEGTLYLLLEPFEISDSLLTSFESRMTARKKYEIETHYDLNSVHIESEKIQGSVIRLGEEQYTFQANSLPIEINAPQGFKQVFPPLFRLCIFGAEHDAVALSKMASTLGWEVHVYASPDEHKTVEFFEGAKALHPVNFEELKPTDFDQNTAIMLMTHSFNKDVQYLLALQKTDPGYFGLLGPAHRREKLLARLMEFSPEVNVDFLEKLHGPAGINIGAENAYEIAVSILGEILSVIRNQTPESLRTKTGRIHA